MEVEQDSPVDTRLESRLSASSKNSAAVLLVQWLILFWMYRRRLFLRI
jgi:hypothetical protein